MKKVFYFISIVVLSSCGAEELETPNPLDTQVEKLKTENNRLVNESVRKDSMINAYALYVNEINQNLELISNEQQLINTHRKGGELGTMASESELIENLKNIADLMTKNDAKIARLNKELKGANFEIGEFEKMIISLSEDVVIKNNEIYNLYQELENIDGAYGELIDALQEKDALIDEQEKQLLQVWYAIGSAKELKNNGVITKEGGLLGIGRINKLKADFNHEYFSEVSLSEVKEIVLGGKSAEILTSHPTDSYEISGSDGSAEKLLITDAEKFWSASKYLVVVLK
jgi:hypothetical protein